MRTTLSAGLVPKTACDSVELVKQWLKQVDAAPVVGVRGQLEMPERRDPLHCWPDDEPALVSEHHDLEVSSRASEVASSLVRSEEQNQHGSEQADQGGSFTNPVEGLQQGVAGVLENGLPAITSWLGSLNPVDILGSELHNLQVHVAFQREQARNHHSSAQHRDRRPSHDDPTRHVETRSNSDTAAMKVGDSGIYGDFKACGQKVILPNDPGIRDSVLEGTVMLL